MQVAALATKGHVNAARVRHLTNLLHWPMVGCLVAGVYFTFNPALLRGPAKLPQSITSALTYDENSYFDLGGGLRGGAGVSWLGSYAPTPESLTEAAWFDLVAAVSADVNAHGADASNWTRVAGLATQPKITRPGRAFAEFSDRLKTGIVAIPENIETVRAVYLVGYVEGRWAMVRLSAEGCFTDMGPTPPKPRCRPAPASPSEDVMATLTLDAFRPTAAAAAKGE